LWNQKSRKPKRHSRRLSRARRPSLEQVDNDKDRLFRYIAGVGEVC